MAEDGNFAFSMSRQFRVTVVGLFLCISLAFVSRASQQESVTLRQAQVPYSIDMMTSTTMATSTSGFAALDRAKTKADTNSCMNGTRVLITGITGMIGSAVARELVRSNSAAACYVVYGIVRPRSDLGLLSGSLDQIHLETGDITDAARMRHLIDTIQPQVVFHFAAQAINGISSSMVQMTMDSNVQGTMNILEPLSELQTLPRVLLAGSSTEYGLTSAKHVGPIPENAYLDPVTPYGISKLVSEKLANHYWLTKRLPTVTARIFLHVGVGGTESLALQQFCKQIAMAEAGVGEAVIRHGRLDTRRDITNVKDSAPAFVALALQGVPGEPYNIGSSNSVAIGDLLDIAVSLSKVPIRTEIDPALARPFDEATLTADINKLQELTGWVPANDMHSTVTDVLEYWRQRVSRLYPEAPSNSLAPPRKNCSLANVDLFIVGRTSDLVLTSILLNSIEQFMPCHNDIHLVLEADDIKNVWPWVNTRSDVILHELVIPDEIKFLPTQKKGGYILQAWLMFWADTFVRSPTVEFVLFLDTDSLFGMPVTCRSLFDPQGRLYQLAWDILHQRQFKPPCVDFVGTQCQRSYMATFPFGMPVQSFPRMRRHFTKTLKNSTVLQEDYDERTTFNEAFDSWTNRSNWIGLSQFVNMGEYMRTQEPDLVRQVFCPSAVESSVDFKSAPDADACQNYVPPAAHLGWGPHGYINAGVGNYKPFGPIYITAAESMMAHGVCLREYWRTGVVPTSICPLGFSPDRLHPIIDLYGEKRKVDWDFVIKTFAPDRTDQGFCSTLV
jgi:GDP-4-dehydro-6-deoxy-D-mannose reductase